MKFFYFFTIVLSTSITYTFAQNPLDKNLEFHENRIQEFEREIKKIDNGVSGDKAQFERLIKEQEEMIENILTAMRSSGSNGSNNNENTVQSFNQEKMRLQKQIEALEKLNDDCARDNGELRRELNAYKTKGAKSVELEACEKRENALNNAIQRKENQVAALKQEVKNLKQGRRTSGAGRYEPSSGNVGYNEYAFLRQFRNVKVPSLVLGYDYNLLPTINFGEFSTLYRGFKEVGTISILDPLSALGHRGQFGFEFIGNRKNVGGNLGLFLEYSQFEGADIEMRDVSFKLKLEGNILPIRLGIIASGQAGYTWGNIYNHQATMNNGTVELNPSFGSVSGGVDVGLRLYLSRFIAFKTTVGASFLFSPVFDTNFFNTQYKGGVGLDFIIPLKGRNSRYSYY